MIVEEQARKSKMAEETFEGALQTAQARTSEGKESAVLERPGKAPKTRHYRGRFFLAATSAVLLAGLLVCQLVRVASLEREYANQQAALVQQHTRVVDNQAVQLLRTSGSLLRWALSAPLVEERFDAIEEHIKPLVREASIMVVAVADAGQSIRVATNHKLEGKALDVAFPGIPDTESQIVVTHLDAGLIAVVPVFDEGREIGRAVLYYEHHHDSPPLLP